MGLHLSLDKIQRKCLKSVGISHVDEQKQWDVKIHNSDKTLYKSRYYYDHIFMSTSTLLCPRCIIGFVYFVSFVSYIISPD